MLLMCVSECVGGCVRERGRKSENKVERNCSCLEKVLSKSLVYRKRGTRTRLEGNSKETVKLPCVWDERGSGYGKRRGEEGEKMGREQGSKARSSSLSQIVTEERFPRCGAHTAFRSKAQGRLRLHLNVCDIWPSSVTPNLFCLASHPNALCGCFRGHKNSRIPQLGQRRKMSRAAVCLRCKV